MPGPFRAGAACVDITPIDSQFLFGYPHVRRYSTGVHDPLLSSALYLTDGTTAQIFVANDIIFVPKDVGTRARQRIQKLTGVPVSNIMLTATHTHSGPLTHDYLSNEADPVVPKADKRYVQLFEDGMVDAAANAWRNAAPAEAALVVASGKGVGTNRRDPNGPHDPDVPVLVVRPEGGGAPLALMMTYCMHPTVLHEDSTLISGDFPGLCRGYLQMNTVGLRCPVLYHTGPSGNQSPRHSVHANTFEEASRLGQILGASVANALSRAIFRTNLHLRVQQTFVDLPRRTFPPVDQAQTHLENTVKRFETLKAQNAPRAQVRTAECDVFGAEETLVLAKAAAQGRVDQVASQCMPAEVQVFRIGDWTFVGWPGEVFIEYSLRVRAAHPNTFVISLANGEFQGYIVTPEAAAEGGYEASNAMFAPDSGDLLVNQSIQLLKS